MFAWNRTGMNADAAHHATPIPQSAPSGCGIRRKTHELMRFVHVRPAWAHTCGCKSRHKLATVSEVKRNCTRATECGKEAWSVICGPMYKNRIQGVAEQGERACNREALVAKAR